MTTAVPGIAVDLLERLGELTAIRDRDRLDLALVATLQGMLRPLSVAIHGSIGEPGNERWTTRARLGGHHHGHAATPDPAWVEQDSLQPIAAGWAARHAAFTGNHPVFLAGPCHTSVFPLATSGVAVGVVEIETDAALDAGAQQLVAGILRVFGNVQALLDYSERDVLTGLLNRKTFDESFLKATTAAPLQLLPPESDPRRSAPAPSGSFWLGLIDIDHFKSVNDRFGHLIGDEVLLLLAQLMRGSFRFHDRLYRYGGEEFVVLMRCGRRQDAALVLERLRRNTERHAFPQVGRLTISIGFTEVLPGDTPDGAFERADKAVYYAKDHGRNQVRSHADLVAGGELVELVNTNDVEIF